MMERKLIAEGGILDYDTSFLSPEDADRFFKHLKENVLWEQKEYINYHTKNKMKQPRLTAWFADDSDMAYTYSGVTQLFQEWTPELKFLREKVQHAAGQTYNSVLLNLYRNGGDSVGAHADDEKELGTNANIASVSLGASRKFVLKQYKTSDASKPVGEEEYNLTHGSLLIMSGTTQHFWKHSIPKVPFKEYEKVGPRINLTFRTFFKG